MAPYTSSRRTSSPGVGSLILGIVLGAMTALSADADGPRYSSSEARRVIEQMIAAHGGMERWREAPTVSFTRKATFGNTPQQPWILDETIETRSRRLYQTWPEEGTRLGSDGNEVWTVGWKSPFPPRFVAQIGFYFLNLPWLTQDPGVILEGPGRGKYPAADREYVTVTMTFDPETGDTPRDRYVLYIEPESHALRAIEYHVSYGALLDASYLPPDVRTIGPFYHVNHELATVDGLRVPVRYSVLGQNGSPSLEGEVSSWSFRRPFDEAKLEKPPEAVVDESSPRRRIE